MRAIYLSVALSFLTAAPAALAQVPGNPGAVGVEPSALGGNPAAGWNFRPLPPRRHNVRRWRSAPYEGRVYAPAPAWGGWSAPSGGGDGFIPGYANGG